MPHTTTARGLRRAELITPDPEGAIVFLQRLLGWLPRYTETGFDCWVGDRQCASVRTARPDENSGWRPIFAGAPEHGSLTGPDNTHAVLAKGRAQHGPWAPEPRLGEPCWIELFATEAERADTFWTDTLRWQAQPGQSDDTIYTADGRPVAARTGRDGELRGWLCYFTVGELKRADHQVGELGGRVREWVRHPVVGEAILIEDPNGAVCGLAQASQVWGAGRSV